MPVRPEEKGSVLSIVTFQIDNVLCSKLQMGTKTHLSHLLYWQQRQAVN